VLQAATQSFVVADKLTRRLLGVMVRQIAALPLPTGECRGGLLHMVATLTPEGVVLTQITKVSGTTLVLLHYGLHFQRWVIMF
jgi:hypothetical protein